MKQKLNEKDDDTLTSSLNLNALEVVLTEAKNQITNINTSTDAIESFDRNELGNIANLAEKSKKEVTEAVIAEKAIPGSGKAKLTMMTSNENIPEQARRYITIRASRIFHDRTLGANALHRFSRQDELVALSILKQAEASVADHNIFNSYDQFTTVARSRSHKLID